MGEEMALAVQRVTAEWVDLFLVIFLSLTKYYMADFNLFLYILAVSLMGCF